MSELPSWMTGAPSKAKTPGVYGITSPLPPDTEPVPATTTHRNVVVGVTILAMFTLLATFFWVGLMLTLIVVSAPGGVFAGHGAILRVLISGVIAIVGSLVTWKLVDAWVE